jgi:hypothetical protein
VFDFGRESVSVVDQPQEVDEGLIPDLCLFREPLISFLTWLKSIVPTFRPRAFLIDCSDTEAAAIRAVFPQTQVADSLGYHGALILYCYYHLFKAVRLQAIKKVRSDRSCLLEQKVADQSSKDLSTKGRLR